MFAGHFRYAPGLAGACQLRRVEMSVRIAGCGRVLFNTTSCAGLCKSRSLYVASADLVQTQCAACRITRFRRANYRLKCRDGSLKTLRLKAVSECACFTAHHQLAPLETHKHMDNAPPLFL